MQKRKFRKLMEVLQHRVESEGKKDAAWLLGFVEGLGRGKLTGYQIGALIDLLLLEKQLPELEEELPFTPESVS